MDRSSRARTPRRPAAGAAPVVALLGLVLLAGSCKEVPLTAAEGTELSMAANPNAIPAQGGVSTITVFAFKAPEDGGGPVSDGTQIFFNTDLGVIEERVETVNGIARAFLRSDGRSGTATVTARSGAGVAAEAVTVEIGLAGDVNVNVNANPATLGPFDVTSEIVATVTDAFGNPIVGAPVIFNTTAGALASAGTVQFTNFQGQAFDRLTLINEDSAVVTATSGTATSSVTVTRGNFGDPLLDSVSPFSGAPGQSLMVTLTGQRFRMGATVSFGEGIAVEEVGFVNSETLRAQISIDPLATAGARTVTVTNADGTSGSLTNAFTVMAGGNVPPNCSFAVDSSLGTSGGSGTSSDPILLDSTLAFFDATASSDPDGMIVSYDWDFGDGTSGAGAAVSRDYAATTAPGDRLQVVLTATDDDGAQCTAVTYVEVP